MKQNGFSLMEMVVIVGIIGIIATIGTNAYQGAVVRARTREAQVNLAAMYAAEKSFYVYNYSYTVCINMLGFNQPFDAPNYFVGFANNGGNNCGPTHLYRAEVYDYSGPPPNGAQSCTCGTQIPDPRGIRRSDCNWYPAGYPGANIQPPLTFADFSSYQWDAHFNSFQVGAIGRIRTNAPTDVWRMDQDKVLTRLQNGE